ncbi:MAG: WYL domain-containing protein [Microthrixaceae bacterium]|nr:WYL domain-containing protein [Microthrixaceae bacterium]
MKRKTAAEQVQRILSILPWIVANPGITVDEVCNRFAIDRKSLLDDLDNVFYNVGIYPFTPDVLADVLVEDDRIYVTLGDYFTQPLRLNNSEALSLLTAAKASMTLSPATDSSLLATAISKLEHSLGIDTGGALDVRLADVDSSTLDTINTALSNRRQLQISYYSFGRDKLGERIIDPWSLANRNGHWYLRAWCNTAQGEREFRLDRVYSAILLDEPVASEPTATDPQRTGGTGVRTVRIVGSHEVGWIARSYPVDSQHELDAETLVVEIPVSTQHWLERLLLRLPIDAVVTDVDTGEDLSSMRSSAAKRILDRYGLE